MVAIGVAGPGGQNSKAATDRHTDSGAERTAAELTSRELTVSELDAAVGGDIIETKPLEVPLMIKVCATVISSLL